MKSLREFLAAAGLMVMVGVVATHYSALPETIPTHFNAAGMADGWGGRSMVWLLVGAGCFAYAIATLASFFPSLISMPVSRERLEAAQPVAIEMTGWVKAEMAWMFAWICWMTVQVVLGRSAGLGTGFFLPVVLVVILGTIGFYLWRILQVKM